MSVLAKIRRYSKWLVAAIGLALGTFILQDLVSSGKFFTGGNDNTIAVINGKKIDYSKFSPEVQSAIEKQKAAMAVESLSDSAVTMATQAAFKNMVFRVLLDPEYMKLGINVPDSEMVDLMLGPEPAPDVYRLFRSMSPQFLDRTGRIIPAMAIRYVKQMNEQDQARWEMLEDKVKNDDLQQKYFFLLMNGIFIPDAMAKADNEDDTKAYNISYVLKRYTDIPDNSVTVTDQDLKDYYNAHLYEYNQSEESRRVDYVTFNASPSDADMANIKRDVDTMYSQLKKLPAKEDSAYIITTDAGTIDYQYHKAGDLNPTIDSIMTHSQVGDIYGPYKEDNKYKIAKLMDVADLSDSLRYSRIVIPAQSQADFDKIKPIADSLKKIATVENFAELATTNSKDPDAEVTAKHGDMGWIIRGKQREFPAYLEHEVFFGKVGNVIEVPVQGGYLLICVMEQSERHKNYQVGIAMKNIEPSDSTQKAVYNQASDFELKNHTSDLFEKAVSQMNRRVVDLGENETTVAGLQTPKEFVRWAYNAKEGDVSDVIPVGDNKNIVAHIIQVTKQGTIPLEQVKEQVKLKVIEQKKADKIIADMKSAASGGLAMVAQKENSKVDTAMGLTFTSYNIPTLGKEDAVIGTMSAMNTGAISQPIQGELGVYVIKVESTYSTGKTDFHTMQMREAEALRSRAPNEAYEALMKKAGLVSHLGRYY